jgi:hypothetical protein
MYPKFIGPPNLVAAFAGRAANIPRAGAGMVAKKARREGLVVSGLVMAVGLLLITEEATCEVDSGANAEPAGTITTSPTKERVCCLYIIGII